MRTAFFAMVKIGDEFRKLIFPKQPQSVMSLKIHPYKNVKVRHIRNTNDKNDIFFICICFYVLFV